ncbi:ANTAR domain-containing protein [Streptomyces sp. NPDC096934]|uniref:ANTAR domain-containing protein n=1 Tax=Streptomyces sp. NPDC096934 TaxID=3155551 RepID=UPI0033301146
MTVEPEGSEATAPVTPRQRVTELREENAQLEEAMRSRAVVDQAVGVVLAMGHLTPEQGLKVLCGVSQATRIKLGHVAELIVDWARTGQLCTDIRTQLDQQLLRHAPPRSDQ